MSVGNEPSTENLFSSLVLLTFPAKWRTTCPVRRGGSGGSNEPPPLRSSRSLVLNSKLSRYIQSSLAPVGIVAWVISASVFIRDFIAGWFPHVQAHDLRTRHGVTQPQTILINKHGNISFARQLNQNVNVYLTLGHSKWESSFPSLFSEI